MARRLSERHLCVLCLERLRLPRILPCFHSFCLECLENLITSCSGPRFACPTCRKTYAVPERGALGFQNNFYLEEDSGDDENNETNVEDLCPHHTSEHLRFYCTRCRVAVCRDCKLTSHEGHVTVDVAEEMGRVKEVCHRVQVHAREVLLPALHQHYSSFVTAVDAVSSNANVQRLKMEITSRGDALKKAVDESVKQSTQALEQAVSKIRKNEVVEKMNKQLEDLSCLCDYLDIVLSQTGQREVLSLPTHLVNFFRSDINDTDGLVQNPPLSRPLPAMSSNDDGPAALIDQLLNTSDPASLPNFKIFATRPPGIEIVSSAASPGTGRDVPSPESACVSQQIGLQPLRSSIQNYVGHVRLVIDRKSQGVTRHVDPDCEANTARPFGRQRNLSLPNPHQPQQQQQQQTDRRGSSEQQPQNTVTSSAAFDHPDVNRSLHYPLIP